MGLHHTSTVNVSASMHVIPLQSPTGDKLTAIALILSHVEAKDSAALYFVGFAVPKSWSNISPPDGLMM